MPKYTIERGEWWPVYTLETGDEHFVPKALALRYFAAYNEFRAVQRLLAAVEEEEE